MTLISATHGSHVPVITIHRGMRLAAARSDAGITQERMAQLLGCTRRTISRWEADDTSAPPAVIISYSVATGTNLGWLQSGTRDVLTPEFAQFAESKEAPAVAEASSVRPKGLEPLTF
ncbi:helix-turn-helix domain-containing protein [uncultured Microbacterium sp.]|uniref:helix-turn-helix domain-containing protein n=1 Tax=uncultured Microbacterium sp. TaxID=191216 RepID=UPI0025F18FE6|nr:helix-turn-helix transcriptional regulator [uncultured Microbacterium sp.]